MTQQHTPDFDTAEQYALATIELSAALAHGVNKAWCEANGDTSQVPWNCAPDWQKKATLEGVRLILSSKNISPAMLHENWSKDKLADGWRYGVTKDAGIKTHPCLVPFSELPRVQQVKDALFISTVMTVLEYC